MKMRKVLERELKDLAKSKYKMYYLDLFLVTIFNGLLPIVLVFMPRMIVSYIENGKTYSEITTLIIIMSSMILAFSGLGALFSSRSKAKSTGFRVQEFINCYRIFLSTDYENIENPKWLDKIERQITALNGDNNGYQNLLDKLMTLLPYIVTALVYIILLSILSPVILIFVIIFFVLSFISIIKSRSYEYNKKDESIRTYRRSNYFTKTASDFSYTKDIKIFNLKDMLLSSIKKESNVFRKLRRQIEAHTLLWSILEVIGMALLFGVSLYFSIDKYMDNRLLSNLLLNIMLVSSLIPTLTSIILDLSKQVENLKEIREYYEYIDENLIKEEVKDEININEALEIEFKNVSFKYPNTENYIFKDLSFKINKEEKIAIVGVNGAGKSTIVKLIIGFFKPTSGNIYINGHDINDFNRKDLYKLYSVVFQDVNVYAFSILENISLTYKEDSNKDLVLSNLDRVGLKDYVESLPNKENQAMLKYLDDTGVELSGGQTQKLAIARALYKENTHCVILDEPTAALDALAEAEIYESFSDLVKNQTAIYISHRLSSTKFCDRIMLFDGEGLKEVGSHKELMALKGKYYEIFNIQGKYYKDGVINEESI